jgi:hypothetical protein
MLHKIKGVHRQPLHMLCSRWSDERLHIFQT